MSITSNIILTKEQQDCVELMKCFVYGSYKNPLHDRVFILDGFAGTGKSTLVSCFLESMKNQNYSYVVLTYTGKASKVLYDKGLKEAQTIHSYIYDFTLDKYGNPKYFLRDKEDIRFNVDFVVVDESSFISDKIYDDLLKVCSKIIYVGDSYQLSIERTTKLNDLDFNLTEPLRFQGYINELATKTRENNAVPSSEIISNVKLSKDYDIMICYRNTTKDSLNLAYRKYVLGKTGFLSKCEKIMFLNNSKDYTINGEPIINGLIITLKSDPRIIRKAQYTYFEYYGLYFWFGSTFLFIDPDTRWITNRYNSNYIRVFPITYAYAITCHKAQGSEWNNVLLLTESVDPHYLYTGITRARKKITLCKGVINA